MCNIISVLNPKGGSGKTTLAIHLAHALSMHNEPTILIDTDPQGSALDWADRSMLNSFTVVGANQQNNIENPKGLRNTVRGLSKHHQWMVIDGAGKLGLAAIETMKLSDFVIIPVQPSALDIWACATLVDNIKERQIITDGKPVAVFQVTSSKKGTQLANSIEKEVEKFDMPIFNGQIHNRTEFARTMFFGETVLISEPSGDAAFEINKMTKQIRGAFGA